MKRYSYTLQHKEYVKKGFVYALNPTLARTDLEHRFPRYTNLELRPRLTDKGKNRYTLCEDLAGTDLYVN